MRLLPTLCLLASTPALAVPTTALHQGRLMDALGAPLDGSHDLEFTLFDAPAGGSELWSETLSVSFTDGYYSARLGETTALDSAVVDGGLAYLEIAVDSGAPLPVRQSLDSVPFALVSHSVSGGIVDASEIRIDGTTVIDSGGAFAAHNHDAADVTGVLGVTQLPVGTEADEIAAGDHVHGLAAMTGQLLDSQLPSTMDSVIDARVTPAVSGHTSDASAHHAPYTDSRADAVAAGLISAHAGAPDAHHAAYDDAAAVAAVAADDAYVSNTGDVIGGALWVDNGYAGRNLAAEVGVIDSESACYSTSRCTQKLLDGEVNFEATNDWLTPSGQRDNAWVIIDLGGTYVVDRAVIYNQNEYPTSHREVKDFTLEWSTDKSSWTSMDARMGFSDAREPNPGWSFRLPPNTPDTEGVSARYFRFTMRTFHGSDGYGGITELQLYEAREAARGELAAATVSAGAVHAQHVTARNLTGLAASDSAYTWSQLASAGDAVCPRGYHVGVAMEVLVRCYMDPWACRRLGGDLWVSGNHDVGGCSRNLLSHSGTDCWGGENSTVDNVPTTQSGSHWVVHSPGSYAGSRGPSLGARPDGNSYHVACVPNYDSY